MKKIILSLFSVLLFAGCVSHTIIPASNGQFVETVTDSSFGATGASAVAKSMEFAKKQCGEKNVKVVNLSNTGTHPLARPEATLIFECE